MKQISYSIVLCLLTPGLAQAEPLSVVSSFVVPATGAAGTQKPNAAQNSPTPQNAAAAKPSQPTAQKPVAANAMQASSQKPNKSSELDTRKCCNPTLAPVTCPTFPILSVPFTVPANGHYLVQTDLTYNGTGFAITIPSTVDNVTIEFCNATLTLTDPTAGGILVDGVNSSTTILNPKIINFLGTSFSEAGIGINVQNSSNVTIKNASFLDVNFCINVNESNGVSIDGVYARIFNETNVAYAAITGTYVHDMTIQNMTINADSDRNFTSNFPIFVGTFDPGFSCSNITLRNLNLTNSRIGVFDTNGALLENIFSEITELNNNGNGIQLGGCAEVLYGSINGIIRNCSFINKNAGPNFNGMVVNGANGLVVENIVVNCNPTSLDSAVGRGGILYMGFINNVVACQFTNCIFTAPDISPAGNGIVIVSPLLPPPNLEAAGIIFRNCLVNNCSNDGIVLDSAYNVSIVDCNIQNCSTNAIHLTNFSISNSVIDTQITNNGGNGITVEGGCTENHIQGNNVFYNFGIGLNNVDNMTNDTEWYFNTSCNNTINQSGVPFVIAPGSTTFVAGANIVCNQG